jgi:hypothetical protein
VFGLVRNRKTGKGGRLRPEEAGTAVERLASAVVGGEGRQRDGIRGAAAAAQRTI